jgi:hypothetical protein
MYRVEKTFLKYLKPETMRIEKAAIGGGYVIIDDAHHHYGRTPTVEEASAKLIKLHSEYVSADHNPYLATEEELAAREPAPLTEAEEKLNELVNNLDLDDA